MCTKIRVFRDPIAVAQPLMVFLDRDFYDGFLQITWLTTGTYNNLLTNETHLQDEVKLQ